MPDGDGIIAPGAPAPGGQGGGQADPGSGGQFLPGQEPGAKPAGQTPGQVDMSKYVDKTQYDEVRSWNTRISQEMAELKRTIQSLNNNPAPARQPAPGASGSTPSLADVGKALGLDEAGTKALEAALAAHMTPLQQSLEWQMEQQERIQFFSENPDMREYEPQFRKLEELIEGGRINGMQLKALAVRGANVEMIVNKAIEAANKDREKTERAKIRASAGGGAGARPGATVEERVGATKDAFNVKNPTFSHKPLDD